MELSKEMWEEMKRWFPYLPHPEHYPQSFEYYLRMYKFLKSKELEISNRK